MVHDPDEVGYVQKSARPEPHTPETCTEEHCSCHLPMGFQIVPNLQLTGREAMVLAWHLFADEGKELDFETIGRKLGVTETRIQQIYTRARAKIRAHAQAHYPEK